MDLWISCYESFIASRYSVYKSYIENKNNHIIIGSYVFIFFVQILIENSYFVLNTKMCYKFDIGLEFCLFPFHNLHVS